MARSQISAAQLSDLLGAWSAAGGPLFRQLADRLAALADAGLLPPGTVLPAERELALMIAVSRTTTSTAYEVLREQGLAETRRGSGTRIAARAPSPTAAHKANSLFAGLLGAAEVAYDLTIAAPDCAPIVAAAIADPAGLGAGPRQALAGLAAGTGYQLYGLPALREAIAAHHTRQGAATTPGQVLPTSGAQQAIDLLMRAGTAPGQAVLVEDPTFPGVLDALARAETRPVAVPVDPASGLDLDALAHAVRTHRPALAYLIPSHHNPTGALLTSADRAKLVAIAAAYPATVFVDDTTLAELALDPGAPMPAPLAVHAPDLPNLATIGSLSKTYWGGLRVGWIRASAALMPRLAAAKAVADLGGPALTQYLAAALLSDHHDDITAWRREQIRARHDALCDALREELPNWSWHPPAGGLTLWVQLPAGADARATAHAALRHGVAAVPGPLLSPTDRHRDRLRLPYVQPEAHLREATRRLRAAGKTT